MVTRQHPQPVREREVVHDPGPQLVIELKLRWSAIQKLLQVDDGPWGKDPGPDVAKLSIVESRRFDEPLGIHRGRRRQRRTGRHAELLDRHRATCALPSFGSYLQ